MMERHLDHIRNLFNGSSQFARYFDMQKVISVVAILVALASTGVFHYQQDLCRTAISSDSTLFLGSLLLVGYCGHVDPVTNKTWLITAAQHGHYDTASFLLKAGVDVAATDTAGRTALHYAAKRGDTSVVELLVNAGADVQASDRDGVTPLMAAALHGHHAVAERLIASGAHVDTLSRSRDSALSLSAGQGHSVIVTLLLEHGADANVQDESGQTPLIKAIAKEHTAVEALLLGWRQVKIHDRETLLEMAMNEVDSIEMCLAEKREVETWKRTAGRFEVIYIQ